MKALIFWGVGGGYGGIDSALLLEYKDDSLTEETAKILAEEEAYRLSYEECESYGIGDYEEDEESREEEIESWIDYRVIINPTEEQINEAKMHHFTDETSD